LKVLSICIVFKYFYLVFVTTLLTVFYFYMIQYLAAVAVL